uniref:Uncharacterized protein n=1 Tax=Ralstonia solanacearum TaxID=305 RepID=A0A0S4VYP7_RALSL|nr:protein of unknown function [Ralstonia solanacearum]CUV39708.1 protein of unknown function [Ralstonia solanacearum]
MTWAGTINVLRPGITNLDPARPGFPAATSARYRQRASRNVELEAYRPRLVELVEIAFDGHGHRRERLAASGLGLRSCPKGRAHFPLLRGPVRI